MAINLNIFQKQGEDVHLNFSWKSGIHVVKSLLHFKISQQNHEIRGARRDGEASPKGPERPQRGASSRRSCLLRVAQRLGWGAG